MLEKNNINLPYNVIDEISENKIELMINTAYGLKHMWQNAFGNEWEKQINKDKIEKWYRKI